jgi:hypothetical protein
MIGLEVIKLAANPYFMHSIFSLLKASIMACLVLVVVKITSAYAAHCFSLVEMFPLTSSFLMITSMAMLKRVADKGSPCFTPLCISNLLEYSLCTFTIALVSVRVNAIKLIDFIGTS